MTWVPGEALLGKLWESLDKAGSGLCRPWQIKREGRAVAEVRRQEALIDAQTQRDVVAVRQGFKRVDERGRLIPIREPETEPRLLDVGRQKDEPNLLPSEPLDTAGLARLAQQDALASEMERTLNLRRVITYAEEVAETITNEKVSKEPIDPDWFYQWRRRASEVSAETMQRLWGKVLAEEGASPGSFSVRSLDLMARLSKRDADLIGKLGPYVVNGNFVAKRPMESRISEFSYQEFIDLEEIGIIVGTQALTLSQTLNPEALNEAKFTLTCGRTVLIIETNKPIEIGAYVVTRVGQELLKLGTFVENEPYLKDLARSIKADETKVSYATLRSREGARITYSDAVEI